MPPFKVTVGRDCRADVFADMPLVPIAQSARYQRAARALNVIGRACAFSVSYHQQRIAIFPIQESAAASSSDEQPIGTLTMINHVFIGVRDVAKSKIFYDARLKPLGYSCLSTRDSSPGYSARQIAGVPDAARC